MRKRDVKRLSLPLVILMVLVFALMAPSLATAELYADSGLDLRIPENEELELHFSILYEDTDLMYFNDASYNSYDEQLGYWFEDIPWLGIASEAPLLQSDEQGQGTSIERQGRVSYPSPASSCSLPKSATSAFRRHRSDFFCQ